MVKRGFDIVFALLILLFFFWVVIVFWMMAVFDTRTNGVFIQERIGQFGKKIKIYKLRTIRNTSVFKGEAISKTGGFLRKYKLDELPQFINVLKGEMSVVGPRPDLPGYYDLLEGEDRKILELKPGMTTEASIKYFKEEQLLGKQEESQRYNDTVIFPDKVKMNLSYYTNQSFYGDIKIILKTLWVVFVRSK
jgi:lipopolysaccharide/colanic/teichoic acid biosynthesis glycosyltransferase